MQAAPRKTFVPFKVRILKKQFFHNDYNNHRQCHQAIACIAAFYGGSILVL